MVKLTLFKDVGKINGVIGDDLDGARRTCLRNHWYYIAPFQSIFHQMIFSFSSGTQMTVPCLSSQISEACDVATKANTTTLPAHHIKTCILQNKQLDFLKGLVASVGAGDVPDEGPAKRGKRGSGNAADADDATLKKRRTPAKRKPVEDNVSLNMVAANILNTHAHTIDAVPPAYMITGSLNFATADANDEDEYD